MRITHLGDLLTMVISHLLTGMILSSPNLLFYQFYSWLGVDVKSANEP